MRHPRFTAPMALLLMSLCCTAIAKGPAYTDPAKAGPDFAIQGEYAGTLKMAEGDVLIEKQWASAFHKTDLDAQLRAAGVDSLVVTGLTTRAVPLTLTGSACSAGMSRREAAAAGWTTWPGWGGAATWSPCRRPG